MMANKIRKNIGQPRVIRAIEWGYVRRERLSLTARAKLTKSTLEIKGRVSERWKSWKQLMISFVNNLWWISDNNFCARKVKHSWWYVVDIDEQVGRSCIEAEILIFQNCRNIFHILKNEFSTLNHLKLSCFVKWLSLIQSIHQSVWLQICKYASTSKWFLVEKWMEILVGFPNCSTLLTTANLLAPTVVLESINISWTILTSCTKT